VISRGELRYTHESVATARVDSTEAMLWSQRDRFDLARLEVRVETSSYYCDLLRPLFGGGGGVWQFFSFSHDQLE
jgi:hypothetical protein